MTASQKRLAGHKCLGVRVAFHTSCECGWESIWVYAGKHGAGGRAGAYEEWRSHIAKCRIAAAEGGAS